MGNCLRFSTTVETAGEKAGQLALAQTPTSCGTSAIMMPLKLCFFICKVGTLPAPMSSVQTRGRAEEAIRQSTNTSCFYLCLHFMMGTLFLSPFLTSGGRLRTSCGERWETSRSSHGGGLFGP